MKITRHVGIVALPVLMLNSFYASAATDRDAVVACSEAIATVVAEEQGAAVRTRIDDSRVEPKRVLRRTTQFDMNALDPSTNDVIGIFRCLVDNQARVVQLRTLSLDVPNS